MITESHSVPLLQNPQHLVSYTSKQYAGAGLIGTGLAATVYMSRQPWFDTNKIAYRDLSRMQKRGNHMFTVCSALVLYGAELIAEEYFARPSVQDRSQGQSVAPVPAPANSVLLNIYKAELVVPWYKQLQLSAPVSFFIGCQGLVINQALHAGVFTYSTFRRSPFWTGKMMIPLYIGLSYQITQVPNFRRCYYWIEKQMAR